VLEVYSKPQALSQCRDWLAKNLSQAKAIEMTSTAIAAQIAADKPGRRQLRAWKRERITD